MKPYPVDPAVIAQFVENHTEQDLCVMILKYGHKFSPLFRGLAATIDDLCSGNTDRMIAAKRVLNTELHKMPEKHKLTALFNGHLTYVAFYKHTNYGIDCSKPAVYRIPLNYRA